MKTCFNVLLTFCLWLPAGFSAAAADSTNQTVLATRTGTVGQAAEALRHWAETSEALMSAAPNPGPAELAAAVEAAREALARQRAEVGRLQRELEELRAARKADQTAESDLDRKIKEWQARLARAGAELQKLAVREAELRRQLNELNNRGQGFGVGRNSGDLKQFDLIVAKGNLMAPTDPPYFTITRIRYTQSGDTGLELEQKQPGIPLGRALEKSSWLDEMLAKLDPKKHFLTVFVAADSIPTYYALRAELRKRDILHQWVAWNGETIRTRSGSGSGTIIGP